MRSKLRASTSFCVTKSDAKLSRGKLGRQTTSRARAAPRSGFWFGRARAFPLREMSEVF